MTKAKLETKMDPVTSNGGKQSKVQTKHNLLPKSMSKRKIGAPWSKKTAEGTEYFSGVISDLRSDIQIVVFRNDKKQTDNQPDYDILLSEPKEEK